MMYISSYLALVIVLLGAVCILSGNILVKALHKLRTAIKRKHAQEAEA